jgi:hypothetical protein
VGFVKKGIFRDFFRNFRIFGNFYERALGGFRIIRRRYLQISSSW